MADTFLFYDLETFGSDPRTTRIAQFAAIRTDTDLVQVEDPVDILLRPANDLLPSPGATLVTGITPQHALANGIAEADAFARMHEEMSRPGTCTLGYNSLRFDDEFVRHGLFRNFFDPYEREWRNGNCRWDLLDVMRLVHALRPDGIEWPQREDGKGTSFKLEHLALANGVREGDAHEALSDVRALIGLARRFRAAQPRLWDYALRLRNKRQVAGMLDPVAMQPVLHVSQRYPASRACAAAVVPLARHPRFDGRVIVFDLDADPAQLLDLEAGTIASRLYARSADLPEGVARIPLKEVHFNRCPAVVAWEHLRPADLERLGIDAGLVEQRVGLLRQAAPVVAEKIRQVYAEDRERPPADPDAAIYDGFLGDADRRRCNAVRATPPPKLAGRDFGFDDPRLDELLFRYRARNWPATLLPAERERWNAYRRQRLGEPDGGRSEYSFQSHAAEIALLREAHPEDQRVQGLLDALSEWSGMLATELG